jgi:mannose-1-phosphate guanylyltransferase/mannose-6-phosphate isomerase
VGLHILVLAGGSGTRLWPLSRKAAPKHLLPLGAEGRTLLRATLERVGGIADAVHVVTTASQAGACSDELVAAGLSDVGVIAEPVARGTGPALGLATGWIARLDPDAMIASAHADSDVGDDEAYRAALIASAGWAAAGHGLATVGLAPLYPSTGMGYIELGPAANPDAWVAPHSGVRAQLVEAARSLPAFTAAGFTEKPPAATAEAYVSGGRHLWNLGLFAWRASTFLDELLRAAPALASALDDVVAARAAGDEERASQVYAAQDPVAVEPLVLERTSNLTAVRAAFPWSDLGSWADFHGVRAAAGHADADGNVVDGDVEVLDARGNTVVSRAGRLAAVIGAEGLVVVDTPDALLVMPRDQAQRVKDLVDRLRANGRDDVL